MKIIDRIKPEFFPLDDDKWDTIKIISTTAPKNI
jgi:hypothetical protein